MEIDLSSINAAERAENDPEAATSWSTWSSSGDSAGFLDGQYSQRGFRCSFCKRGFSNAQALGGHMNIHRKDRAKLKEFACSLHNNTTTNNILSLDITKWPQDSLGISQTERSNCSTPINTSCCWATTSSEHDQQIYDRHGYTAAGSDHELKLSLFTETSSSENSNKLLEESNSLINRPPSLEYLISHVHGESFNELDLELRLGPEPHAQASRRG